MHQCRAPLQQSKNQIHRDGEHKGMYADSKTNGMLNKNMTGEGPERDKIKYGTDYMRFDKNQTVINDDVYYWDIIYENRKYLIRDDKFKSIDFTVTIGNETRNLSFVYYIDKK